MRVFPGNVMQPASRRPETGRARRRRQSRQRRGRGDADGRDRFAGVVGAPIPSGEAEVVEGDVVQEMNATPPVVDGESPPAPRSRTRRQRRAAAAGEAARSRGPTRSRTRNPSRRPRRASRAKEAEARGEAARRSQQVERPRRKPGSAAQPSRRSVRGQAASATRPRSPRKLARITRTRQCVVFTRPRHRTTARRVSSLRLGRIHQVVHADAEEPHRPAARLGAIEQRDRARGDVVGVPRRRRLSNGCA